MKIAILVAMEKELRQLRTLLSGEQTESVDGYTCFKGIIGTNDIVLMQCGVGKVNAALGAQMLIRRYAPDVVVSSGVAGGCGSDVKVMDVVVSTECCYHDVYCGTDYAYGQMMGMPERFASSAEMVEKALTLDTSIRIHAGTITTGDWFVNSREKMRDILCHVPDALAVDMESASIAHTCYLCHTPFLSFRIISDTPLNDEGAKQYYDFWQRIADGSFEVIHHFISSL